MKFEYRKFPAQPIPTHPKRTSILRPVIPIRLIHQDKDIRYEALIDSGADYCIFHAQVGEFLEVDVKSGLLMDFFDIEGVKLKAYFHNITLEVGGWEYKCYCGFSYNIDKLPYGILGQNGFFNLFEVKFDILKERIELKKRD